MQIVIGIAVVGIIVAVIAAAMKNKKKNKKNRESAENQYKGSELHITKVVREYMGVDVPVVIVRSPDQKIPHFANKVWDDVEHSHGKLAKAFYLDGRVYVKKWVRGEPTKEISNEIYFKLLVHEFNHALGLDHGDRMISADSALINEIRPILVNQGLI